MKKTNSWYRLLSLALCLCMVLSLVPALQGPVSAVGASAPVVNEKHIYAQGTPLYIVAGTSSGTAIYYLNGSKKVYLNSNGAAGNDMSSTIVWGGYRDNALDGDVNITMTGGKISRINGTGYDYYNTKGGYVNNVNITISGGTVSDAINAGWRNPVNGNVNITMTGGSVGKIYGCCSSSQASVGNADVKVCGNVNLRITGGSVSEIHGGDGYKPVNGTVSAVVLVPTKLIHNGISSDKAYYFDNVLYLNGSTWTQKDSVGINAGETLTVAAGQTLTLKDRLTNHGTIVNNGTVKMTGAWTNNGSFINNGTLNKTYAQVDDTVTVDITCAEGWAVRGITITGSDGTPRLVGKTFTMPASNVTVSVSYMVIPTYVIIIPATVELGGEPMTVAITNAVMEEGVSLKVHLETDFTARTDEGAEKTFAINAGAVQSGDVVLMVEGGGTPLNPKQGSARLALEWDETYQYSGNYRATLAFTIRVEDEGYDQTE